MGKRQTLLYKGDCISLKYVFIFFICVVIISIGYGKALKHRSDTQLLDQAVRLIGFIKTELNYRRPDCEELYRAACDNGIKCICFNNGRIKPSNAFSESVRKELNSFFSSIGTTDTDGQLALCDEYYERIKRLYDEQRGAEKSKIQVNFAVSLLCVFTVIVLFL